MAGTSTGCSRPCRLEPLDETPASPAALIDALVFDLDHPDSVLACVTAARENARQVREEISSDMWEQLNALFLRLKQARTEGTWSSRPHYICRMAIEGVHLFQGVTDATMAHGEGWQYLQVGRYLERAGATAALVDLHFREDVAALPPTPSPSGWGCCDRAPRSRRTAAATPRDLRPERIAEFLLLNPEFPRSVRFAAARVESALRAIAQLAGRDERRPRRAAGGPAARVARLRPGRRDPERGSARVSRGDRPLLRPDPRGGLSELHHVSDRVGAAGLMQGSKVQGGSRGSGHAVHHPARDALHLRVAHHARA